MNAAQIAKALDQIRYDLSVTQTRVIEIAHAIKTLELPADTPTHQCPDCPRKDFRTTAALQDHRYHHHNGPLPDTDARAEQLAGLTDEPEHPDIPHAHLTTRDPDADIPFD